MISKTTNPDTLTHKTGTEAIVADAAKMAAKAAKKPRVKAKDNGKKAPAKKAKGNRRGGGKPLGDFSNAAKIKVLKAKEIVRAECFRTGQTVEQNLAAQKAKGFRGRRKYIRKQVALKRIVLQ